MSKYRITGEQTIFDNRNLLHYDLRWDAAGCRRLRTPLNNGTPVSNLVQASIAEADLQCRASRFLHWTEDSRLHTVADDRHYSYYAYDHGGELGMSADNGSGEEVYFYHSDHLGSASWITGATGSAIQHLQYLPYGEEFVNQRTAGYQERYTFTGKEKDAETGYGYFGARYMDHELMTMWLSVDPMADKYPNISPYAYCAWNPLKLVDPDGRDIWKIDNQGNIVEHTECDDYDQIHIIGNNGDIRASSCQYEFGTISELHINNSNSTSFSVCGIIIATNRE